jgi:predicted O-methyltransferase YrrM
MKLCVTLTTIFQRQKQCARVLQSLLQQTRQPDEIYLFVSSKPHLLDKGIQPYCLDPALYDVTQKDKRIRVEWVENSGPYRKLLPLLKKIGSSSDALLITCDDDTLYKKEFLETAERLYQEKQCCIGFQGTRINNTFAYNSFEDAKGTQSLWNLAKGFAGIVYSPSWFTNQEVFQWKEFPTCDDLWFAAWRIAAGVECYIAEETSVAQSVSSATKGNLWSNYNETKNSDLLETILHLFVYRGWIQGQESFFSELSQILFQWNRYLQANLLPLVSKEDLEGNIWSKHTQKVPDGILLSKQKNIVWLAQQVQGGSVLEIGFNAGFSSLLFLLANPKIRMTAIDLGDHEYAKKCAETIQKDFGDRLTITFGDSRKVLPEFSKGPFECIHIDGGHSEDVATSDLQHSTKRLTSGGLLLLDDTNLEEVTRSLAKIQGLQEVGLPYPTSGSHSHRLYRFN